MNAKTYALESGGYVCSLKFLRSDRPDQIIVLFEEIDLTEDVDKFFYVFDPSEVLGEKTGNLEQRNDLEQNFKRVSRVYEQIIFAFLDQFQFETVTRCTKDKPRPPKKDGAIWSKVGIG